MLNGDSFWLPITLYFILFGFDRVAIKLNFSCKDDLLERVICAGAMFFTWCVVSFWMLGFLHLLTPDFIRLYTLGTIAFCLLYTKDIPANIGVELFAKLKNTSPVEKSFFLVILLWIIFGIFRCYILPPMNTDSLGTHLVIPAIWLQDGTVSNFNTDSLTSTYPVNLYFLTMFHLSFLSNNAFIEIVQLESWLFLLLCCLSILKHFQVHSHLRFLTVLIIGTFPIILATSATNQTDLGSTSSFTLFLFYLSKYFSKSSWQNLWLAAASFGLFFGTRHQGWLILPVVAFLIPIWLVHARRPLMHWLHVTTALLSSFMVLGFTRYALNYFRYGILFSTEDARVDGGPQFFKLIFNLTETWPEIFLDQPLLPFHIHTWHHDVSCFGLIFSFIAVPLAMGGLVFFFKRGFIQKCFTSPMPILFLGGSYFIMFGFIRNNPGLDTRKYMIFAISTSLFAAWALQEHINRKSRLFVWLSIVTYIFLIQYSGWYSDYLSKYVTTSLALASVSIAFLPGNFFRNINFFKSLFILTLLAVIFRYILSVNYDHRVGVDALAKAKSIPGFEHDQITLFFGTPSTSLSRFVDNIVPKNGNLYIAKEPQDEITSLYFYFDRQHRRRVRILSNWDEENLLEANIRNLNQNLKLRHNVWLLLEQTNPLIDSLGVADLKIVQKFQFDVFILYHLQKNNVSEQVFQRKLI